MSFAKIDDMVPSSSRPYQIDSYEISLTATSSKAGSQFSSTLDLPQTIEEIPENAVEQEDIPPNGGYGWVVCLAAFLISAHTWGVNSAWGIFLAHYLSNSTFPDATHLEYALIGGLSISQSLLIAPIIGFSNRSFGTRITLLIGTFIVFLALFCASFATQIWHLFVTQGLMFGWGMGFLYVTASSILPQWFSSHRSLANGIASSGAGLGGLAYNLAAEASVSSLGVVWTYRILAFCCLAVNLLCALLMKDRNKSVKPIRTAFNYKEYARIEVLLVVAWGVLTELGYIVLLYSLPNYAASIGLTSKQGSIVGAVLNLGLGIGRPVVGYYSDSFGRINMASLTTFICGILCLALWLPATTYPILLTFALLVGTVCGTFWACVVPVTVEVVGLKSLPSSFGMVIFALVVPTTFAEPIALAIVGATRGYLSSQVFVGVMFLAGASSVFVLRSWKLDEIERKREAERENSSEVELTTMNVLRQENGPIGKRTSGPSKGDLRLFSPKRLFFIGRV